MGSKLHSKHEMQEIFADRLKELRKSQWRGVYDNSKGRWINTQEKFAEEMDVSIETVRNWEQGRFLPEIGTMFKIADTLDCDLDYLTGRLDKRTHDLQFIHEQTGLSEKAIKRLQQFKPDWEQMERNLKASYPDVSEEELHGVIQRQRERFENSVAKDYLDVLSIIIEDIGSEYLLSLVTRRVTKYKPHTKTDKSPSYKELIQDDFPIDLDGQRIMLRKRNLLDSLIQSEVANLIPIISEAYHRKSE